MKIHIIGGSGTGKTYIAKKISERYHIPHFDLDDIFWDNTAVSYGAKMPVEKRTEALYKILETDSWVIEGVFYDWLDDSFRFADTIFILQTSPLIFNTRIIKRFLKRKLGMQKGKRETLKSLVDLLTWTNNYQKNKLPTILQFLDKYKNKVIIVKKSDEILKSINTAAEP